VESGEVGDVFELFAVGWVPSLSGCAVVRSDEPGDVVGVELAEGALDDVSDLFGVGVGELL